jgi:tRNA A-37 threonylcarbamoyl transferase component Bud32
VISRTDIRRLAAGPRRAIKEEPAAIVEVLGADDDAVVRKTYRNSGIRWLQSFLRCSRAHREHDLLRAVHESGVRCLEPLAWTERRSYFCVDESTIVTRFVRNTATLKEVLPRLDPERDRVARQRLVAAAGQMVAALHRHGILWGTPMPRNVLVLGNPADARLAICDTPSSICMRRSLHGRWLAIVDIYFAAFSQSRRCDYSAAERLRWLLAYGDGDRELTRGLWRRATRRSRWFNTAARSLARAFYTHLLGGPHRTTRLPTP